MGCDQPRRPGFCSGTVVRRPGTAGWFAFPAFRTSVAHCGRGAIWIVVSSPVARPSLHLSNETTALYGPHSACHQIFPNPFMSLMLFSKISKTGTRTYQHRSRHHHDCSPSTTQHRNLLPPVCIFHTSCSKFSYSEPCYVLLSGPRLHHHYSKREQKPNFRKPLTFPTTYPRSSRQKSNQSRQLTWRTKRALDVLRQRKTAQPRCCAW